MGCRIFRGFKKAVKVSTVVLPCYIHDIHTYRRHVRWIRYMDKYIKPRLGYDRIILLDNASDLKFLKKLGATIHSENNECLAIGRTDLYVYRFNEHLPRKAMLDYPYFWRFVYKLPKFQGTFYQSDKYYHIDSDNYIQTQELIDYMRNCNSGFVSFWDSMNKFPTSELFILNQNAMPLIIEHSKVGFMNRAGQVAENVLPFTHKEKKFYGGRLAERGVSGDTAHWVGQVTHRYKVKFRG